GQKGRIDRRSLGDATVVFDFARVRALVDHANAQEQCRGDDSMVDHLENRTLDSTAIECEDAQGDEAHVADARECDEPLDVRLNQGNVGTPNNGHGGNHKHGLKEQVHAIWKYGKRHTQKTVGTHLE